MEEGLFDILTELKTQRLDAKQGCHWNARYKKVHILITKLLYALPAEMARPPIGNIVDQPEIRKIIFDAPIEKEITAELSQKVSEKVPEMTSTWLDHAR